MRLVLASLLLLFTLGAMPSAGPRLVAARPRAEGTTATSVQEAFPMVCRGGHRMTADYRIVGSGPDAGERVVITFGRSPVGARERPPGNGQCAWLDRPINDAEGFTLRTPPLQPGGGITLRIRYGRLDWPSVHAPMVRYLVDAVGQGEEFHVTAFTNRAGQLEIRTVGASARAGATTSTRP